jgi:FkbM family methyltransferase
VRCPDTDLGFADSPMHGSDAQQRLMRAVLALMPSPERRGAIDVGAHIGTWTLPLAKRFQFVDAFEPVGSIYRCLYKNVGHLTNVKLHSVAAGSHRDTGSMMNLGDNSGCGFVVPGQDFLVALIDDFDFTDIDLIKLDVEGYEGHALAGARRLLDRCKPAVFFEDNGVGRIHHGEKWIDPKAILSDFGYRRKARIEKNELWCFA